MKQRKTKRRARRPGRRRRWRGVLGYAAAAADEGAAVDEDAMDGEWSDGDANFLLFFLFLLTGAGFFGDESWVQVAGRNDESFSLFYYFLV